MRFYHFRVLPEQEERRHFLSITKSLETMDDVLAEKINKMAAIKNNEQY